MRIPRTDDSEALGAPLSILNDAGQTLSCGVYKDRAADNLVTGFSPVISYTHNLQTLIDNPTLNWNNLGTFRKIKFVIQVNTYTPIQFLSLDATVRKAQH
jgi:hypothetical protein